jgi:acetyl esterase
MNATAHSGNPRRILLFGQSAGATHVANALFDPHLRPKAIESVCAAVLMSGLYSVTARMREPNIFQYFGTDERGYERRSPLTHVGNSQLPVFLLFAEYDPVALATPTLDLARAICLRDGKSPPLTWLRHHNHISGVIGIGSTVDNVGPQVLAFFREIEMKK